MIYAPRRGRYWIIPNDAHHELRVDKHHPHRYVHHRRIVIDTGNGLQEFSKRHLLYTTAI